jgi:diguanylate cyclase
MFEADLIVAFVQAAGTMALTAMAFGIIIRTAFSPVQKSLLVGILFSFTAIFAMLTPFEFAPGVIVDGRGIMVGLGAAFGGIPAAIVVSISASAARLYIGGSGAIAGIMGIILAAALGLIWMRMSRCSKRPKINHLIFGGAFISLQFLTVYLLPIELANKLMVNVFPILFPAYIMSAVVLGTLIERERKLIESARKLEAAANTDALTGLMNRRGLEISIASTQQNSGKVDSVVVFDLDHFKSVNDKFGHEGGDQALVSFSTILKLNARETDVAVRLGGEEFALFLRDTTAQQATAITNRILQSVRTTPIHINGRSFPVTVSAGVSQFRAKETEYWQAIREADQALYQAKNNGRDQMVQATDLAAA